ncbi:hypothetical protein N7495_004218 [Penicillium taxi]|uniref:uncharacterized protein n=1 Tax=Penicillium taxi TaxID=168475 RepID=UPI002544EAA0|nr:uncharacterized protein N7495_004218 [Penicillium taxi]KAJ5899474.1 hypothetical protein N7495_004218 [Penicillium taxi]
MSSDNGLDHDPDYDSAGICLFNNPPPSALRMSAGITPHQTGVGILLFVQQSCHTLPLRSIGYWNLRGRCGSSVEIRADAD